MRFHVDNMVAVFALQNRCIWDRFLQNVARSIWLLAVIYDITLEYTHIPGTLNVKANILSRVFSCGQFKDCWWWSVHGSAC